MEQYKGSRRNSSRRSSYHRRGSERRRSFILVGKEEEEEMNLYSYSFISHLGIPILYIIAGASVLSGIICMAVISKYWANLDVPMCFLYSTTPNSNPNWSAFGTTVSCCYFVAFGAIPPLIICVVCGFLYVFYVRDDKDVNAASYGCVIAMVAATIFLLAVTCTLSQGLRITCMSKQLNPANNNARSCKQKLDDQVEGFTMPISTSSMVSASLAAYWLGWCCFMMISFFHVALVIRRVN